MFKNNGFCVKNKIKTWRKMYKYKSYISKIYIYYYKYINFIYSSYTYYYLFNYIIIPSTDLNNKNMYTLRTLHTLYQ
jgi:hypothetical protein